MQQDFRLACFLVLALVGLSACTSGGGGSTPVVTGHGALSISVSPNPIIARKVSGSIYDFPFTLVVREVGGLAVRIDSVSIDVDVLGGLRIYSQSFDAAELTRRNLPTYLGTGAELRYQFKPRRDVTDDRLFSSVSAELTIRATDAAGAAVTARSTVTVQR
jgi:hypothetical protein